MRLVIALSLALGAICLGAPAASALCVNADYTVSMTANLGDPLNTQSWPGGTVTLGDPGCQITLTRPSGSIILVGAIGDSWSASIPFGSGIASVSVVTANNPNCTAVGAIGAYTKTNGDFGRPSCSVGFGVASGSTHSITVRANANPALVVGIVGSGTVTSTPAGISCPFTCQAQFSPGTVTLTAAASAGSHFTGWTGGGCAVGPTTCALSFNATTTVTANFAAGPPPPCTQQDYTVTMAANIGPPLLLEQTWPGGTVSVGPAGCTVTVTRPSGSIILIGSTGDSWGASVPAGSGVGSVTLLSSGPNSQGQWGTPSCTALAAISNYTVTNATQGWGRPACTAGLGTSSASTANIIIRANPKPVLTVSKTGTGTGTVTSSPAGIDCGATCAGQFNSGTSVTLTATPTAGNTFDGWSGSGCSGTGACQVTLNAAAGVTATFTAPVGNPNQTLTVAKTGTGTGTVTSNPAGIDCGATCSAQFAGGTSVTLTATPTSGSTFSGWSGSGCSGTGACQVTLNAAAGVTATFTAPVGNPNQTLTVAKTGTGTGTVTSNPAGIDCGATCSAQFAGGTSVTLTATPTSGSTFSGWSGSGCSGTGTCQVALSAATTVTASFAAGNTPQGSPTLTVAKAGTGTGSVTSSPAGIDCGATCAAQIASGTNVTLTATPAPGSAFAGWSGGGCSGTGLCQVLLTANTTVTATFAQGAAAFQPDGLIALGLKSFAGNNIYNTTGKRQTKAATRKAVSFVTYRWTVQNDGTVRDTFVLKATANQVAGITVKYVIGTRNVTRAVKAGTQTIALNAGKSTTIKVTVTVLPKATIGAVSKLALKATSKTDKTKSDTVRANTTVR